MIPKQPEYIGIDSSGSQIRTAHIKKGRHGYSIVRLGETVNPLYISGKELLSASAVPTRFLLVRRCEIHVKNEKDLTEALDFQVEPLLPYPAERAIIQAEIFKKQENSMSCTIFALRKDHLQTHLDSQEIEPEKVVSIPTALAAFSTLLPDFPPAICIVHVGAQEVTCALVQEGKLLATRGFARTKSYPLEIQKTLLRFSTAHKSTTIDSLLLVGEIEQSGAIEEATGLTPLLPTAPTMNVAQEDLTHYALAIGIAVAASQEGPDFRQKEFVYPHRWRRLKKPLSVAGALTTLLVGTLFIFSQLHLSHQREAIQKSYSALTAAFGEKGETSFDSPQEYLLALSQLRTQLNEQSETHPLHPKVPKIKELLAWLTTLPEVNIYSLHYSMVEHPTLNEKTRPYQVQVVVELSAQNAQAARTFHDTLEKENLFVDTQQKVDWSTARGTYRASFFLKDQTRYQ